jgi:hypothetical protein
VALENNNNIIKKIKIITSRTFLYHQLTNAKTEEQRERGQERVLKV